MENEVLKKKKGITSLSGVLPLVIISILSEDQILKYLCLASAIILVALSYYKKHRKSKTTKIN